MDCLVQQRVMLKCTPLDKYFTICRLLTTVTFIFDKKDTGSLLHLNDIHFLWIPRSFTFSLRTDRAVRERQEQDVSTRESIQIINQERILRRKDDSEVSRSTIHHYHR